MVWGLRLFSSWHSSTPSRRVCAKSNTCAVSAVTRWFAGSTLQLISHIAHCLQYSMLREREVGEKNSRSVPRCENSAPYLKAVVRSMVQAALGAGRSSLCTPASPLEDAQSRCSFMSAGCTVKAPLCSSTSPSSFREISLRGGRNSHDWLKVSVSACGLPLK